jgi:hypothetical protein
MRQFKSGVAGLLALGLLSGCASTSGFFSVTTDEPDAIIYVNGEVTTPGRAIVEYTPMYGLPKSFSVVARRPGATMLTPELRAEIKSEPDYTRAGLLFGGVVSFSLINLYLATLGYGGASGYWIGGLGLLASPLVFFTSDRFQPTYRLAPPPRGEQ